MEDKLKPNVPERGFHYPSQYETMSVETALSYLELARDGHGLVFEPDNYDGFLTCLVLKCGVDIDYALGSSFVEDCDEIKKHMSTSNLSQEQLKEELERRLLEREEKEKRAYAIDEAKRRYKKLTIMKQILLAVSGKKPTDDFFNNKSTDEINGLYSSEEPSKKL